MKQTALPKVFITARESVCDECGEELGSKAWIMLAGDRGALCLACADLDHLVFLPAGETAVTRRARKYSTWLQLCSSGATLASGTNGKGCWSRIRRWSRPRRSAWRRRGPHAAASAASGMSADLDQRYIERFAARVRELYPRCPLGRETIIAEHACLKYSGRVGRTAAAKSFAEEAVDLAGSSTSVTQKRSTIGSCSDIGADAMHVPASRKKCVVFARSGAGASDSSAPGS